MRESSSFLKRPEQKGEEREEEEAALGEAQSPSAGSWVGLEGFLLAAP